MANRNAGVTEENLSGYVKVPKGSGNLASELEKRQGRLRRVLVEGSFFLRVHKRIAKKLARLARGVDNVVARYPRRALSRRIATGRDTIMFATFQGEYTCNPKYITEELLRQGLPYRIVWAVKPGVDPATFPKGVVLVRAFSFAFFCEAAAARVWVDNALNFVWRYMPKKKEQTYFVTWHGSLGLKRISPDSIASKRWLQVARYSGREADCMISNSAFEDDVYRTAYWPSTEILRCGHARNDIMFEKDTDRVRRIRERVYAHFDLKPDTRILLYAPTYREDGEAEYGLRDYDSLTYALTRRFGGEWVIFSRMHFRDRQREEEGEDVILSESTVINASEYPDIQELMVAAAAGLTDYSSWIYDFMLTGRPCFIFAPDLASYNEERAFYYPLESTPFPLALDEEDLAVKVLGFDEDEYARGLAGFLEEKGCVDDGRAAERIVGKIREVMEP
jgi:CDP-glycerol glycerophosphotransferase